MSRIAPLLALSFLAAVAFPAQAGRSDGAERKESNERKEPKKHEPKKPEPKKPAPNPRKCKCCRTVSKHHP